MGQEGLHLGEAGLEMLVGIRGGRIPESRGKAGSSGSTSVSWSWLGSWMVLDRQMYVWQNLAIYAFNFCLLRGAWNFNGQQGMRAD